MELAPGIVVNGVKITPEIINAEVQYHSAGNYIDAKYQAMQALVIKELLLQEAANKNIKSEGEEDDLIDILLEQELSISDFNEDDYLNYYNENKSRFMTSPLFQVSHILYLAPQEDKEAYAEAKAKADKSLALIKANPKLFEKIAKQESACSSSGEGGRLGQINKGETMPAFEAALVKMQEGDMSDEPVATEVGYHIIRLHKRAEGKQLDYEAVSEKIADFLEQSKWRSALNEYIQELEQKSEISGFKLKFSA